MSALSTIPKPYFCVTTRNKIGVCVDNPTPGVAAILLPVKPVTESQHPKAWALVNCNEDKKVSESCSFPSGPVKEPTPFCEKPDKATITPLVQVLII